MVCNIPTSGVEHLVENNLVRGGREPCGVVRWGWERARTRGGGATTAPLTRPNSFCIASDSAPPGLPLLPAPQTHPRRRDKYPLPTMALPLMALAVVAAVAVRFVREN